MILLILNINANEVIAYDLLRVSNSEQIPKYLMTLLRVSLVRKDRFFIRIKGGQHQYAYYGEELKKHDSIQSMPKKATERITTSWKHSLTD